MKVFILILVLFHSVLGERLFATTAADTISVNDANNRESGVLNLGLSLEGQVVPTDVLVIGLNMEQEEYNDYIGNNASENTKLTFIVSWRANDNSQAVIVSTTVIDEPIELNVSDWSISIENANLASGDYYVEAKLDELSCGIPNKLPIIPATTEPDDEPLNSNFSQFECGEEYEPSTYFSEEPLVNLDIGVINISDFPISVSSLSQRANGSFSGQGVMSLPFGKAVVAVDFDEVFINKDGNVILGTIRGVSDHPGRYPNFQIDDTQNTLNFGGDICLPEPPIPGQDENGINTSTGLDDRGFDPVTGTNTETGTKYDKFGFDKDGNHEGGGRYNECGCDREGLDENQELCREPNCGPNPESKAFAENQKPNIKALLESQLIKIVEEVEIKVAELDCPSIRSDVEGMVSKLGFDTRYIFGENNEYIEEGLHKAFAAKPEPLNLDVERDEDVVALEISHISLYDCDVEEYPLKELQKAIASLKQKSSDLELLQAHLIDAITLWTDYEYKLYVNDKVQYQTWIRKAIGEWLREKDFIARHSMQNFRNLPYSFPGYDFGGSRFDPVIGNYYEAYASVSRDVDFFEHLSISDREVLFEKFMTGAHNIGGISRAFYLEGLAREQHMFTVEDRDYLMPVELSKMAGNVTYTIYFDNIVISFDQNRTQKLTATLDAYLVVEDPETNRRFAMSGHDISFGPSGATGNTRLVLESDIELRLNNAAMLKLSGGADAKTYASWDCNGFESLSLSGSVEFCRNFITPLDENTLKPIPGDDRFNFEIEQVIVESWLEFYAEVSAPPFALTGQEDIAFQLTNLILDFSSAKSPDFVPLMGYTSPFYDESKRMLSPLWKGVYINELSATLPNEFDEGSENSVSAGLTDVLIDGSGFTGGLFVDKTLVSIDNGNIAGWPFSVERLQLSFIKNKLSGGGMGGRLKVPLFEEAMPYDAAIHPNNSYTFTVATPEDLTADVFVAKVKLEKNSIITVSHNDQEGFIASALLSGTMGIGDTEKDGGIASTLPSLSFQDLEVRSSAPYLVAGTWGVENESKEGKVSNFPVVIGGIEPYFPEEDKFGLQFIIKVNLVDAIGIGAAGTFSIIGKNTSTNGRQRWSYDGTKLEEILVDAEFSGASVKGGLTWYDDTHKGSQSKWGKGFRGIVDANFGEALDINLQAAAQFGTIGEGTDDEYKYFFVDALADLGTIGESTGVIQLKGFGGGLSYNMDIGSAYDVVFGGSTVTNTGLPALGVSYSGTRYTPDSSFGLGLKATALVAVLNEEVLNGTVSLIVEFNDKFGLKEMTLEGSAQVLAPIDPSIVPEFVAVGDSKKKPSTVKSAISAYLSLKFDFQNKAFHGNFDVYVDMLGVLKGGGAGGKAVAAEFHADPKKWYMYIGRPEKVIVRENGVETQKGPASLIFQMPVLGSVTSEGYFCIGSIVPASPPLPSEVRRLAYKFKDNPSLRQSGAGMVFGAKIDASIGGSIGGKRKIVTAQLRGYLGFDAMLRKYDKFVCKNTQEPIGINGWYAASQAYAYLSGELKIFGLNIARAGIAAALQARFPNPFFAQAAVGVEVKVLFFKGRKSLSLTLGDDSCILTSTDPNDEIGMDVILTMTPLDGDQDVESFAAGETTFSLQLDTDYQLPVPDADQDTRFRARLLSAEYFSQASNTVIPTNIVFSADKSILTVTPQYELPSEDIITYTVEVEILKDGRRIGVQKKSVNFKTAKQLSYIPETNLAYSYPMDGMYNFYPEEYYKKAGFIRLNIGQPRLLEDNTGRQFIRITDENGKSTKVAYTYDNLNNQINFPLDPNIFNSSEYYKLELVRTDASGRSKIVRQQTTAGTTVDNILGISDNKNATTPPPAGGNTTSANSVKEEILFTATFRTSAYRTFDDKIAAVNDQPTQRYFTTGLIKPLYDTEFFDDIEVLGSENVPALITLEANTYRNDWLENRVEPFLEKGENCGCLDIDIDGMIDGSQSAVTIPSVDLSVNIDDYSSGTQINFPKQNQRVDYAVDTYLAEKYKYYTSKLICLKSCLETSQYIDDEGRFTLEPSDSNEEDDIGPNGESPRTLAIIQFMNGPFPRLSNGTYKVNVKYMLPGGYRSSTSSISFEKTFSTAKK